MNKIILKMNFGSTLYGTSTINSDIDIKGIFLPTKEQLFLNRIPKCITNNTKKNSVDKNSADDVDNDLYSLHYFLKLAIEGETAAIDMLHVNDENVIEKNDIWDEIVKHRSKFYTKNLKSFISYARNQAAKYGLKGSRLQVVEEVIDVLKGYPVDTKLLTIWDKLPITEHSYYSGQDKNGNQLYNVCGKQFQHTCQLLYIVEPLQKYLKEYGERAKLARENKGLDYKALSHAIRAALQVKEILTTNNLVYPLKDAQLLLDVKLGKLDYLTEINPTLENLIDEVIKLSAISTFPEKVDTNFWDNFIIDVLSKEFLDSSK